MDPTGDGRRAKLDQIAFLLSEGALGFAEATDDVATHVGGALPAPGRGRLAAILRGAADMGRAARDQGEVFLEVVRLYADAIGCSQSRARSDILFVQERLSVCASGGQADSLFVHQVGRRVVLWVAEGQRSDTPLAGPEGTYGRLVTAKRTHQQAWKSPEIEVLHNAYRQAWRDAIEADRPD